MVERRGPGLAKTKGEPLVKTRAVTQARAVDGRWRRLFDSADTVTEGAVKIEGGRSAWYGSTSIVLPIEETTTGAERDFFVAVAERDLHVRLRAVRAARREATFRAPEALGPSTCEIHLVHDERGVRIDIDIEAPMARGAAVVTNSRLDRDDR